MLKAQSRRSGASKADAGTSARRKTEAASALQRLADVSPVVSRLQSLGALSAPMQRQANGVQQFKRGVLQLMDKPAAENQKLKNIVNSLFKGAPAGGDRIGDGSAMAAANQEANGGEKVGGRDHVKKLQSIINGLNKLLDRDENPRSPFRLSDDDYNVAVDLVDACEDALAGVYQG